MNEPTTKPCMMTWEAPLGGAILSEGDPLTIEIKRMNGSVVTSFLVSLNAFGGKLNGVGIR